MVHGSFSADNDLPVIQIPIVFRGTIVSTTFILDTGFSGFLKIDQCIADELGIVSRDDAYIQNAQGERIQVRFSQGYAELENKKKPIIIIIADGPALAGMSLFVLFEYKIVIDSKNRTVHLESAI